MMVMPARWRLLLFLLLSMGARAQTFSYPATPVNCSHSNAAYPTGDLDRCTLPGETPFSTFPVPAVGSSYIDANFGSVITLLSSYRATGPSVHGYYAPTAFNASGTNVAISVNTFTRVINAKTGALVRQTTFGNVTYETLTWDATNDDVFWWFSGTKLSKYVVSTNTRTEVLDFSTLIDVRTGSPYGFTSVSSGGRSDSSKDNWKPMISDPAHHQACLINLNSVPMHVYCADYTITRNGVTPGKIDRSGVDGGPGDIYVSKGVDSVSHKRYANVITPTNWVIFSLTGDPNNGVLNFEELGPEHSHTNYPFDTLGNQNNLCEAGESCYSDQHNDTFEDSDGQQYIVGMQTVQPGLHQERRIIYMRLNAGILMARTASEVAGGGLTLGWLVQEGGGIDTFLDSHVGCAKDAPYCVYSSQDLDATLAFVSPTATSFTHNVAHQGTIAVMRGVNQEIRQIAYSRSPNFSNDTYWSYPRACISNDGTQVLFDSNLGYPNGSANENVLSVYTGFGSRPPLSCDLNADQSTDVADVQIAVDQVLGEASCTNASLTGSGTCEVIDVQRVVNAALGGVCKIGP